jgi:hypothetical protein
MAIICNFKLKWNSLLNEHTCDIFMNEVRVEEEPLQELEENENVWKEGNRNPEKKNEEKMKEILKKVHAQKLFWKPHSKNALCWAFFYVNDNKEVDLIAPQIMHYFLLQ